MSRTINSKRAMHTNIRIVKLLAICLALVCLVNALFAAEVYAESPGQITLSVEQIIVNNSLVTPPRTPFTYRLVPKTADAPMPNGSGSAGYTFTITGSNDGLIGPIDFNAPGVFIYELSCITDTVHGFTIDRRVYTIEVHVTNDLQVTIIVYVNEGTKLPGISFEHIFRALTVEPVIPPRPGPELERPGRVPNVNRPVNTNPGRPSVPSEPGTSSGPGEPGTPGEPNIPEGPGTPSRPGTSGNSPRTGDFSNPALWITLIVVACALLIFLSFVGMKSKGESKGERDN